MPKWVYLTPLPDEDNPEALAAFVLLADEDIDEEDMAELEETAIAHVVTDPQISDNLGLLLDMQNKQLAETGPTTSKGAS